MVSPARMKNPELVGLMLSWPDEAKRRCTAALRDAGGNRARAAAALGVGERTLYRWIKKYPEIEA
jgi:transposase-like protein